MATATLTTLTPVHIGNGQKLLRDFDFVVEQGQLGFIDLEKVVEIIGIDQIAQLTTVIEKKESVIAYLKSKKKDLRLEDFCHRISNTTGKIEQKTTELKEHYYTALKGLCIPGSSLKGSLRTGMVKYLTSETRTNSTQQTNMLNSINWNSKPDKAFANLDTLLFGETANAKTTKYLLVSDIHFENTKTEVQELSYLNLTGNGWVFEQHKAQLVECIPAKLASRFELKISLELASIYNRKFQELQRQNPERNSMKPLRDIAVFGNGEAQFLANMNQSTLSVITQDLFDLTANGFDDDDYLQSLTQIMDSCTACKEGEAITRIGGHSGWNYMTNRWMIYEPAVFTDELFDRLQTATQKTTKYLEWDAPFPKTRKLTQSGTPMGFVKVSL